MDLKIVFGIIVLVLAAIATAILMPGGRTVDEAPKLPWLINTDSEGYTEVFGLTIGQSTLSEAEQAFSQQAKLSLFRSPEGDMDIEAYFDRIFLSGLKANIVLRMDVDEVSASKIFERGLRISQMGSGSKKVELAEEDRELMGRTTFELLTYLPAADLDPELIAKHFGDPEEKIRETEKTEHWLYPAKGLDIAVNSETKEVFQYVIPKNFHKVREPLQGLAP